MLDTSKVTLPVGEDKRITVLTTDKVKPKKFKPAPLDSFNVVTKETKTYDGDLLTTGNFAEEVEKTRPKPVAKKQGRRRKAK